VAESRIIDEHIEATKCGQRGLDRGPGTGGVADEADYLLKKFSKSTNARVFQDDDPGKLLDTCLNELRNR